MKTVNLLPAWYLQQQRRHKNLRLHIAAMILLGAAMVGLTFLGQQHRAALEAQRQQLAARLAAVGNSEPELKKAKADLKRLEDLRQARRELGNTVPMSAVIQQLQNAMTPGMALSKISIEVRPDPIKGSGFVGDHNAPPRYHDVAHLLVEGMAPNDAQIAQLIREVTNNPLFNDVTLDYTRTGALQGYSVRKFEIQIGMDLEKLNTESPDALAFQQETASAGVVNGR